MMLSAIQVKQSSQSNVDYFCSVGQFTTNVDTLLKFHHSAVKPHLAAMDLLGREQRLAEREAVTRQVAPLIADVERQATRILADRVYTLAELRSKLEVVQVLLSYAAYVGTACWQGALPSLASDVACVVTEPSRTGKSATRFKAQHRLIGHAARQCQTRIKAHDGAGAALDEEPGSLAELKRAVFDLACLAAMTVDAVRLKHVVLTRLCRLPDTGLEALQRELANSCVDDLWWLVLQSGYRGRRA